MTNLKQIGIFFALVILVCTATAPAPSKISIFNQKDSQVAVLAENHYPKGTFIFDIPTLSRSEKNDIARKYHKKYPKLVEIFLELRRQNAVSASSLKNIHKHISDYALDSSLELPHNDKDLIDYLYDNNLINELQYKKILELLED